jgi:hypothetical protein
MLIQYYVFQCGDVMYVDENYVTLITGILFFVDVFVHSKTMRMQHIVNEN